MTDTYDVTVSDHGSIHLLQGETPEATAWLEEHTDGQWLGTALAVEPRYTVDLLLGMHGDGFRVPLPEGTFRSADLLDMTHDPVRAIQPDLERRTK